MTRSLRTLLALPMFCATWPGVAAPTHDELQAVAERQVCESPGTARVVFAGYSSRLGECLERLGSTSGPIDELRITSRGGDAWVTLQTAQSLHGRLDLIVIDGMCASACANYLLPAAKRLRVESRSYVLLHGSMSQRDAAGMHDAIRRQLREQLNKQAGAAELTETAVDEIARKTIEQMHADLEARIPVQGELARATLACDDWLDMWPHFGGKAPPEAVLWILVTPEMAARCLKSTKIESFWAPEAQEAFEPQMGFFRARK